jgi:membrane protein DedA with SNARE-associated domain
VDVIFDALAALEAALVEAVSSPWMLLVLFLVCVVDGVLPPVPSELVLLTAATVTWTTDPSSIPLIILAATAGAWIGDNIAYTIGRSMGGGPLPWMRRGRSFTAAERVRRELHRRPESILLTGRFVPVVRVLVNILAGAARLRYRRYLVLSLIAAAAWVCLSTLVAIIVGALVTSDPLLATTITVAIAVIAGGVVDRIRAVTPGLQRGGSDATPTAASRCCDGTRG